MKKLAYSLLIVMIVTLSIFLFISCGEDKQDTPLAQVTVKFIIEDKVYSETTYKEGDEIPKPDITSYGAYSISHWTVNGTTKYAMFPYTVGNIDLTFYAATKREITVSFYAEGENVSTKKYDTNGLVKAPDAPELEGYRFMGWKLDDEIVTFPYSLKKYQEDSIRFDAVFERLYKAKFISFGETYSELYYTKGSTMIVPEDPQENGYSFICWEDSQGNSIQSKVTMDKDVEYTARFEQDLYQINYYVGQSATPYKTLYTSLKAIDLKYEGEGDFYGWYTSSSYTTRFDFTKLINRNVNIYGKVYKDDYSILQSFGKTQKATLDTSSFDENVFDTTYPTTINIGVNSNTVRATYSFTSSNRQKGTIVYDMFLGSIYASFGTNDASISIGVDEYNYGDIDFSNYRYSQSIVNAYLNPELKKIALKVAETVFNHIHGEYSGAKTEVITSGNDFPEITFNVNAKVSNDSIIVTSDTTFYSLKVYSVISNSYIKYVQSEKNLTISNLATGNYILTFAFDKTIDNYKIRQYYSVTVSI